MAKVMRAVVKSSESGATGNFVEGSAGKSGMFTTPKKVLPNHNPKQPWLGLPMGPHTHAPARDAVHDVHGVGPGMTYTGMARSMPKPEETAKSRANENDRVQDREPDYDEDRYRGKSGVD